MIIDFSISNFRSIRQMQTLSFEATNDKHLEEYFVIKVGKYRLLKIATILGANASGKSNVLKAFYMLRELLLEPCQNRENSIDYDKFALDEECLQRPSVMKVNFIVGESKYMYEVEFDNRVVYHELLKCQPFDALKEHLVYERSTDKENLIGIIKWGKGYCSTKNNKILTTNLLHNRTLFGAYQNSNVNIPCIKEILDWIRTYFMPMVTTSREQGLMQYVSRKVLKGEIDKQDLLRELKKADLGVVDFNIKDRGEYVDVYMIHSGNFALNFSQESSGTQRYYELCGLLLDLTNNSHFIAIDDLDYTLHPDLFEHFVMTYIKNSNKSQIVISTHMREFLENKNKFRADSIYFTEKCKKGNTDIYPLTNFERTISDQKLNLCNSYKEGRFGAVPYLEEKRIGYIQYEQME